MADEVLGGSVPVIDLEDPAQLEALYGNYSFFDHYRKSVLSECYELERAKSAQAGEKITEKQLENRARLHPNYLDFLSEHFNGRHQREQNVRDSLITGQR